MTPPRYRTAVAWAGAYAGLFVLVAGSRLALMGADDGPLRVPSVALYNLLVVYHAGLVFALPLIWVRRRLARGPGPPPRWPVVTWLLAAPVSAFGVVIGGLLGPLGILLYGGLPIVFFLGGGFALSTLRSRDHSRGSPPR